MKLQHWMKREKSGLAFTTLEIVQAEERQGHAVDLRQPDETPLYGGFEGVPDVHLIHSQIPMRTYHDRIPKFLWTHGEPLSSVGNGVSMKAIVDLAGICEAFISMRKEEWPIWQSIKKTYVVPKGIDLQRFTPVETPPHDPNDATSKLSGEPAVLYCEHWRGQRNPLYVCAAMERVAQRYPKARLHMVNCTDPKMLATFKALIAHARWSTFIRTLSGPVNDAEVNRLYNRADIVVSALYPLYARSVEAFGAGKPMICAGYTDPEYPYRCTLDPDSMADAICAAWENRDGFNARQWAEQKHDVDETVRQSVAVYERYL